MVFVAVEVVGWKSHAMICLSNQTLKTLVFVDDSLRFVSLCLLDIWRSLESILFSHLFFPGSTFLEC